MKLKLLILYFVFSSYIINAQSFDTHGIGIFLRDEGSLENIQFDKAYPVSLTNGQGFATDFQTKLINKNNVK